jgi:outer membrane protein TolC
MWTRFRFGLNTAVLATAAIAMNACGPPSSRYRDELSRYDRAVPDRRAADDGAELFAGEEVLRLEALIEAVLERNPSIESAREGWRAALARYPQVTSFDDPMVSYSLAPLSIGSDEVDFGQAVELSLPLPYPGKRRLRGQVALAEAQAAREDYEAVRLRIALMAAQLYYELYVTERAIAIYGELEAELRSHSQTLNAHLAAGHAWQDDALKVDVDLGEVEQVQIELAAERDLIEAQLNELLHRRPDLPLPAAPEALAAPAAVAQSSEQLQAVALERRPELRAAGARRDRESARIASADREFYPDFRVMGRYDSMWPHIEHELMVGVAVTIPLWRGRRHATVDEYEARRDRADVELEIAEDRIRTEVERAYRAHAAALVVIEKYRDEIVPAAIARVDAIRVGLDGGRTSFIEVLRADHDRLTVSLRYQRALANAHRRRAELEIAIGRIGSDSFEGGER